jgi:hypothetical protein
LFILGVEMTSPISHLRRQAELGEQVEKQVKKVRDKAAGEDQPSEYGGALIVLIVAVFAIVTVWALLAHAAVRQQLDEPIPADLVGTAYADEVVSDPDGLKPVTESNQTEERHWSYRWDDIQATLEEKHLWHISQHWDGLTGSGCDPYLMAAIWYRETGMDVTSNNPFQVLGKTYPNFDVAAKHSCAILKRKSGDKLPDEITPDNLPIVANALFYYNGTAYRSWEASPYVVSHLDRSRTQMAQCAVDGCKKMNTSRRPGTLTFYLMLMQDLHK